MEFDESNYKPNSNRSALYNQVLEQSDICDVTIQVGEWRKKFHWCVLVMSPFFESLRRNNFIEKQTGIIKFNIASPLTTETAILYLYGKKPKLTEDNISAMVDMSEFLVIPNLKSSCVRYIKTVDITSENCMQMLELSSLYDFELTKCYEYIRGHLDDTLNKQEATRLTKDSVIELLTDPHLSYVTPEDRFSFLVKWSKECPRNEAAFPEVFRTIDLDGMDTEFLEREVLHYPLVQNECDVTSLQTHGSPEEHRVFLFSDYSQMNRLACFDLDKEKWYGIDTSLPDESEVRRMHVCDVIRGVRGSTLPEIYKVDNSYESFRVCKHNLQSKQISTIEVTAERNKERFSCFSIQDETFAAVINKKTGTKRKLQRIESSLLHIYKKIRARYDDSPLMQGAYASGYEQCESGEAVNVTVRNATLFYGQLQSPITEVHPVVTILDTEISTCVINPENRVALLSDQQKTLYIYDMASCQIDIVQLEQYVDLSDPYFDRQMKLVQTDKGFVLHNKKQVVVISRLYGPALSQRYMIKMVDLEYDKNWVSVQYFYCDKTWLRFLKRSFEDEMEFASVSHERLTEGSGNDLPWRQLPITKERDYMYIGDQAFVIRLHRSLLKCHFSCPHCEEQLKRRRTPACTSNAKDDDYEDLYDDSDDDYAYNWNLVLASDDDTDYSMPNSVYYSSD